MLVFGSKMSLFECLSHFGPRGPPWMNEKTRRDEGRERERGCQSAVKKMVKVLAAIHQWRGERERQREPGKATC